MLLLSPFVPVAQANIFDDMNSTYFANMSFVTYDESQYVPDTAWQSSGCIRGWVDVVGFRKVVRYNDIDYVPGTPIDYAIVKHGTGYYLSSKIVPGYGGNACYWCFFESISDTISVGPQGNNTVAALHVTLNWHETVEGSGSSQTFYYSDHADFYDSESSPVQYPAPNTINLTVHEYKDKKVVYFNKSKWITGYEIATQNGSTFEIRAGNLEHTQKNVPYINFTRPLIINNISGKVTLFGDGIMMENTSFSTKFYTPYSELNLSKNVTIIKHESTSIQPFIFYFVFICGVIIFGIIKMVNLCRN